jgi:hypothetical protein
MLCYVGVLMDISSPLFTLGMRRRKISGAASLLTFDIALRRIVNIG